MTPTSPTMSVETRPCPYCGKAVPARLNNCPFCREAIRDVRLAGPSHAREGRDKMRRGLLYILLAAIIHYFVAGYSPYSLPVTVPGFVTQYLTPLLFLAGLGYELYGIFLYLRS